MYLLSTMPVLGVYARFQDGIQWGFILNIYHAGRIFEGLLIADMIPFFHRRHAFYSEIANIWTSIGTIVGGLVLSEVEDYF